MARNPSAHSLDHGNRQINKESSRTPADRLSWTLFDEKIGPFGDMAALGSQSAWEGQMENHLKVFYFQTGLMIGYIPFCEANTPTTSSDYAIKRLECEYESETRGTWTVA